MEGVALQRALTVDTYNKFLIISYMIKKGFRRNYIV